MADEIYVVMRMTVTPQRFELSQEERDDLVEKWKATAAEAGGERVLDVNLGRLDGKGPISVYKFPSNDAWVGYLKAIFKLEVHKYFTLDNDVCVDVNK